MDLKEHDLYFGILKLPWKNCWPKSADIQTLISINVA